MLPVVQRVAARDHEQSFAMVAILKVNL